MGVPSVSEILCEPKYLQNIHDWLSQDGAVKEQPYNYKYRSYFELVDVHKTCISVSDLGNIRCTYEEFFHSQNLSFRFDSVMNMLSIVVPALFTIQIMLTTLHIV